MLTQRQKLIFKHIVDDYSKTGLPVGSKNLAQQLAINVSSATIRNEMSELAEKGLITQVHTSSGRVPSNKGYRYYLDNLASPVTLDVKHRSYINALLGNSFPEINDIVKRSADGLSKMTDYTAMTFSPETTNDNLVKHFELVSVGGHNVIAIVVMENGQVESQSFLTNDSYDRSQLEKASNFLNDKLSGKSISEILNDFDKRFTLELNHFISGANSVLNAFIYAMKKIDKDRFFISGRMNLLNQNHTLSEIKPLYKFLNEDTSLNDLFTDSIKPVSVKLGSEINDDLLKDYSVISGTYDVGVHGVGKIAVIGPTRMVYPKVLGLVDAFRNELQKQFNRYYANYDK